MAGVSPFSLPDSTQFTPKTSIKRKAVPNASPPYTLHSPCSIPSIQEHNLQESLQVQLHLIRNDHFIITSFILSISYAAFHIKTNKN